MPFLLKSSFTNSFGPDINVGTKLVCKLNMLSDDRSGTETAVLGCSAEGFDCRDNPMVRAFSIAFKHCCGAHTVRWTVALRRPKRSVDHAVNI